MYETRRTRARATLAIGTASWQACRHSLERHHARKRECSVRCSSYLSTLSCEVRQCEAPVASRVTEYVRTSCCTNDVAFLQRFCCREYILHRLQPVLLCDCMCEKSRIEVYLAVTEWCALRGGDTAELDAARKSDRVSENERERDKEEK